MCAWSIKNVHTKIASSQRQMHTCMQCTIHYIATALFLPIRILSVSLERLDVSAEMESCWGWEPSRPSDDSSITIDRDGVVAVIGDVRSVGQRWQLMGLRIEPSRDHALADNGVVAVVSEDGHFGSDDSRWGPRTIQTQSWEHHHYQLTLCCPLPSQTVTLPALMSVAAGATSLPTDVVVPLSSETVGVPTAITGVAGDWRGVVAVVGDGGCCQQQWKESLGDWRGVVAVGDCVSSGGSSCWGT